MPRKKSPMEVQMMVDGGVNLLNIIIALVAAVRALATKLKKSDAEWTTALHRLSKPEGRETLERLAEIIMVSAQPAIQAATAVAEKVTDTFKVMVDYLKPTYDQLKASFDWVNGNFAHVTFELIERCKGISQEAREITFQYVHLGVYASTEAVLAEMYRMGLRPATYLELLAFAKQFPNEQRKHPILALGSFWVIPGGYRGAACLDEGAGKRGLSLLWCVDGWRGVCRFLAVAVSK